MSLLLLIIANTNFVLLSLPKILWISSLKIVATSVGSCLNTPQPNAPKITVSILFLSNIIDKINLILFLRVFELASLVTKLNFSAAE